MSTPRKPSGNGELESRLDDLQVCKNRKLITEEEYRKTKQQLLDTFSLSAPPPQAPMSHLLSSATLAPADGIVSQSSFIQEQPDPDSLMRFGFGLLVSPQVRHKRMLRLAAATEGRGQFPVRLDSTSTLLKSREEMHAAMKRWSFWCSFITRTHTSGTGEEAAPAKYTNEAVYDNASPNPWSMARPRRLGTVQFKAKNTKPLPASIADLQVYDITAGRVKELFGSDKDDIHDGSMNATGLKKRLGELNLSVDMSSAERLIQQVQWAGAGGSSDNLGGADLITVEEFDLVITSLRLAELFTPEAGVFRFKESGEDRSSNLISICDYNPSNFKLQDFASVEVAMPPPLEVAEGESCEVRGFFFDVTREASLLKTVDTRDHVRWVHVDASENGLDRLTILRLATKYHLHPLAVEDVIDNRTQAKVDDFEDHYFVSMDVITLLPGSEGAQTRVRTQRSNASIFLSKAPVCDTLLSIFQDRPDESSWLAMWRCNADAEEETIIPPKVGLWKTLHDDIKKDPPIRVREQKGDFLLYEILDRVVDELRPITEAYSRRLGFMHQSAPWTWSTSWLDELSEVNLELTDLARSIRPMRQVVHHFINDKQIGRTSQTYLEDTEDQIDRTLDDLSQLKEMIGTLTVAYEGSQDKSMNLMLFILSIVSGIFLPAQFVTGLYGMNFDEMPELKWTTPITGYQYFWVLLLIVMFLTSMAMFSFNFFSRRPHIVLRCCRHLRKVFRRMHCCRKRTPEKE